MLKKLFGIGYFLALFFAVLGIRMIPIFNFRISHGYNLDIHTHVSDFVKINYKLSLLSRFDWWMNIIMFLFFPLASRTLRPGIHIYKIILLGICTSVCIELLQFILNVGMADINDVVANSLGCMLGSMVILVFDKMRRTTLLSSKQK